MESPQMIKQAEGTMRNTLLI